MTAELTPDYDERTSLSSIRMSFSIIGGVLAAIPQQPDHQPVPAGRLARLHSGRGHLGAVHHRAVLHRLLRHRRGGAGGRRKAGLGRPKLL